MNDGVTDSAEATVTLNVLPASSKRIKIEVFQNGQPVVEGQTVTGTVTGQVTVYNSMHEHAQFYKNFRIMHPNEHGHGVDSNVWVRTFTLDTAEFFDGENLVSVHSHPHNHHGMPYNTDITIGTFRLRTANSNPSPSGDTELPEAYMKPGSIEVGELNGVTFINPTQFSPNDKNDFLVFDDMGNLHVEQSSSAAGPAQVIPHLGASVLGRFRWLGRTPPHGEFNVLNGTDITNFRRSVDTNARITFFISDQSGRANYAFKDIVIPAMSAAERDASPMPSLDAHFLNLDQGDSVLVPDDGSFIAKVKVTGVRHPKASIYKNLTLWLGNSALKRIDITPYISALPANEDEFELDIPINAIDVTKMQTQRESGQDPTAFAIWMDFAKNDRENFPTSEHVHLTSIRTVSYEWPYGDPSVYLMSPSEGDDIYGPPTVNVATYGAGLETARLFAQINEQTAVEDLDKDGVIELPVQLPGTHSLKVYITDASGSAYTHSEGSKTININILNTPPQTSPDAFETMVNSTLSVDITGSILNNDLDVESNPLSAILMNQAQNGSVSLSADGTFQYTPNADFSGIDWFTYAANDGYDNSTETTVYVSVLASPSGGAVSLPWSTQGGNFQRTGLIPGDLRVDNPVQIWQNYYGRRMNPVVISGSQVFMSVVGGTDTFLTALELDSGLESWRYNFINGNSTNPPSVANGAVYIQRGNHSSDSQLFSIDSSSGNEIWQSPFQQQWASYYAPVIADGKVFIPGGSYGGIYGYNQSTGAQLFFQGGHNYDDRAPAYSNGKLYTWVAGYFNEYDADSGDLLRTLNLDWYWHGYDMRTMPVISGNFGFVIGTYANRKSKLKVVDLNNFSLLWQSEELNYPWDNGIVLGTPAVSGQYVYVINDNSVYRYNFLTGIKDKTYDAPQELLRTQPIISNDKVIVSSSDNTYIFDLDSGSLLSTLNTGGNVSLSGDKLITADSTGNMTCYLLNSIMDIAVNVNAGEGSVIPSNSSPSYGDPLTLNVQASSGYKIKSLTVNGVTVNVGLTNTYSHSIASVTEAVLVDVEFESIQPKLNAGLIEGITENWQTVNLPESYFNPIVVTTPVNSFSSAPFVTRIRNLTSNSFEIKAQRVDGSADPVGLLKATYTVVDEGIYTVEDHGVKLEAFAFNSQITDSKNNWVGESVSVETAFTSPVMFGQVMSYNDTNWSTFWSHGTTTANPVSDGNYYVGKHVGEDSNKIRSNEELGCIIIEAGTYTLMTKSSQSRWGRILYKEQKMEQNLIQEMVLWQSLRKRLWMEATGVGLFFTVLKVLPMATSQ